MRLWGKWVAKLSVLFLPLFGPAQFILSGELHEERFPVFHPDSIRQRGIRTITIRVTAKPSSRPIYDRGRRAIYSFDTDGRLVMLTLVFPVRYGRLDTIIRQWNYERGRLVSELESTGSYQRRTRYSSQGERLIEVKHRGGTWQSVGKEVVQRQKRNMTEVYSIATLGNEPYEQRITTLNEQRSPVLREAWNGQRLKSRETWEYTDSTLLYRYFEAGSSVPELLITYKPPLKQPETGRWCYRAKCQDWSMLYEVNGLPKAWLFFEPVSQDMEIWEFRYVYRAYSTQTTSH